MKERDRSLEENERFMKRALKLAEKSDSEGEVPVGAVIVKDGEIIAVGRNKREKKKNALFHAEIEAINKACKKLGQWRLLDCDIYVTLEPCPMCAGAIINSRIRKVYFGAKDPKAGACGSVVNLFDLEFNHKPELKSGILEEDCSEMLRKFFKKLRKRSCKVKQNML